MPSVSRSALRSFHGAAQSGAGASTDEWLAVWAIWLFCIGGGVVREVLGQTQIVELGFYTFHSVDPALVISALAAATALAKQPVKWTIYSAAAVIMATLITVNFVRGIGVNSASALLWLRANGGIATLLLLAISVRPSPYVLRGTRTSLLLCAALLSALVIVRLAFGSTVFMISGISADQANDGGRALSVVGPFLMIFASGMLLSEMLARKRLRFGLHTLATLTLPLFILATRQGTASIAELAVLLIVFVTQRGPARRDRLAIGIVMIGCAMVIYEAILPLVMASQDLAQRVSNLETRREIWAGLMAIWPNLPLSGQAFGIPAGQLPNIIVYHGSQASEWTASIHSMYYGALPIMGYVGAAAWVVFLLDLSLASFKRSQVRVGVPSYAFALCVATAILSYSYEVRGEELIGVFVAIWWLRAAYATTVAGHATRPNVRARKWSAPRLPT